MPETNLSQILTLKEKSLEELKAIYEELFPIQQIFSNNKVYLWHKIVYRMQETEFGGLSSEAKIKLEELIQKYDPVNNIFLRPESVRPPDSRRPSAIPDRRLPIPGSIITKNYKGQKIQVKVLEDGFEYNDKIYRTLSAVASEIGGQHWNGYLFFGL